MSLKQRVGKLENYEEARNPKEPIYIILCFEGKEPTEEEIEAAKKKFWEEHPDHKDNVIVLNFKHLREERIKRGVLSSVKQTNNKGNKDTEEADVS